MRTTEVDLLASLTFHISAYPDKNATGIDAMYTDWNHWRRILFQQHAKQSNTENNEMEAHMNTGSTILQAVG